jgi:hypothetical protein
MDLRVDAVATLPVVAVVQVTVLAGAWLLALAGVTKAVRPAPTHRAVRTLARAVLGREPGLPPAAVRVLGLAELAAAVAVLTVDSKAVLWPLAAFYAGFTGFVVLALATGAPLSSCGCFGRDDAPPTLVHVVVDAAIAALAVAAATDAALGPAREALGTRQGLGTALSLVLAGVGFVALGGAGRGAGRRGDRGGDVGDVGGGGISPRR